MLIRQQLNQLITHPVFPMATLLANVLGCFFIGLLYPFLDRISIGETPLQVPITVGLLGGLTTFSSFSIETIKLLQSGYAFEAILNILVNILLSLLFCYLGLKFSSLIST